MSRPPIVDDRDAKAVLEDARGIVPHYTDEWDPDAEDAGATLLSLFAEMVGDVTERLNQVPEKHRIAFFDALGFGRKPPQPSRLPLTFRIPDDIDENVVVPAGTQSVAPARGDRPEQVFEILEGDGFEATPASVQAVHTVDPSADDIFGHWDALRKGTETQFFDGTDLQRHALVVAHEDLLTLKGGSKIWVTVETDPASIESGVFTERLEWECYCEVAVDDEKVQKWYGVNVSPTTAPSGTSVTVELELPSEITETKDLEVGGIESRWIRCRVPTDEELREESRDFSAQDCFGVEVRSVNLSLIAPADGGDVDRILPDDLLSGDVPLAVAPDGGPAIDLFPFGEGWPLRNTFYVASEEAFTKESVTVTLEFAPTTRKLQDGAVEASIEFAPQNAIPESNGRTVIVDSASLPSGGFVGVYEGNPADLLGDSGYLEPGAYENVEVSFEQPVTGVDEKVLQAGLFEAVDEETVGDLIPDAEPSETTVRFYDGPDPSISWEYWDGDGWALLAGLVDQTAALRQSGTVSFPVPTDLEPTTAAGHEGHWIRARLVSGEYLRLMYNEEKALAGNVATDVVGHPPQFGGLDIYYERESKTNSTLLKLPDHLVTRNNLADSEDLLGTLVSDPPQTLRPFFGLPDDDQTLYVGFDGPLRDGPIQILFSIADEEYPAGFYPRVRWEYCVDPGDDEWARLDFEDETESLTQRGIVGLSFREPTRRTRRFGQELHWIRARLDGNAFVPGNDSQSDQKGAPISITSIDAGTDRVVIANTGEQSVDLGGYRIEFECAPPGDRTWTFPDGTTIDPRGVLIVGTGTESDAAADVQFEYDDRVLDDCVTDAVAISTPDGEMVTRRIEGIPDPCERWLETVPPAGQPDRTPPIVRGFHPNTGWASNVESITGEILGSSDGTANQKFVVSTPPVTEEDCWVNELSVLSDGERRALRESEDTEVEEMTGPGGDPVAFWVQWTRVADFLDSNGDDRHYRLDPTMGRITFGNGIRGAIPPRGTDNVRIDYRTGGGADGNVEVGSVTDLVSSIPFVESTTNEGGGDGGADAETVAGVVSRAPKVIRDRKRAVTKEDVERITMDASRRLARTRCIPAMDEAGEYSPGWVTVLIVPDVRRPRPVPSVELKHRVATTLDERAPAPLVGHDDTGSGADGARTPELVVRGPSYVEVSVETTVSPGAVDSISALEGRIQDGLNAFLHPLTGGESATGWGFGELPCLSDLYALFEGITGVDHVAELSMTFDGDDGAITVTEGEDSPNVAADTLIYSGTHAIEIGEPDQLSAGGGE